MAQTEKSRTHVRALGFAIVATAVLLAACAQPALQHTAAAPDQRAAPQPGFASALVRGLPYTVACMRWVRRDGIAARLGLRAGDIIVGFDGQPVGDSAELARLLLEWHEASRVRTIVVRDGSYLELRLP